MRFLLWILGWICVYGHSSAQSWTLDWHKMVGAKDTETPAGIQHWKDDLLLVYGDTNFEGWEGINSRGNLDVFLLCVDTAGNIKWLKQFGGSEFDEITQLCISNDKNLYITVHSNSTDYEFTGKNGMFQDYLIHLDEFGNLLETTALQKIARRMFFDQNNNLNLFSENFVQDSLSGNTLSTTVYWQKKSPLVSFFTTLDSVVFNFNFNLNEVIIKDSSILWIGESLGEFVSGLIIEKFLIMYEYDFQMKLMRSAKFFLGIPSRSKFIGLEYMDPYYYLAINLGDGEIVNASFPPNTTIPTILQLDNKFKILRSRYIIGEHFSLNTAIDVMRIDDGVMFNYLYTPSSPTPLQEGSHYVLDYLDSMLQIKWTKTLNAGGFNFSFSFAKVTGNHLCLTYGRSFYTTGAFALSGSGLGNLPKPISIHFTSDIYLSKYRLSTVGIRDKPASLAHCPVSMTTDPLLEQHLKAGHYPGYDGVQWWDVTGKPMPTGRHPSNPGLRIGWVSGSAGGCVLKVVQMGD